MSVVNDPHVADTSTTTSLPEGTLRVLASYWAMPEAACALPEGVTTRIATQRPSRSTVLSARISAHAGRPPAFLKILRRPVNFDSEYQGLVNAHLFIDPETRVRVPHILHTVEAERAVVLEYIPGSRLTPWLRRRYLAPPAWLEGAVRDLGHWLAAYHEYRAYYEPPQEFAAGHLELTGRYLDDAASQLGPEQYMQAHRVLEAICAAIATQPVRLTWCHGDLACNNLIAYDDHLYVIDFTRYGVGPPEADLICFWNSLRKEIGPLPFSMPTRNLLFSTLVEAYEEASPVKANPAVQDLWVLADLAYEIAYASRTFGRPLSVSWMRKGRLVAQTASYLRSWLDDRARVYGL